MARTERHGQLTSGKALRVANGCSVFLGRPHANTVQPTRVSLVAGAEKQWLFNIHWLIALLVGAPHMVRLREGEFLIKPQVLSVKPTKERGEGSIETK